MSRFGDATAANVASLVHGSRTTRPSLLPGGSAFVPPWRPREDVVLGDGMIMSGLKSFDIDGLHRNMASSDEDARDAIETILEHMQKDTIKLLMDRLCGSQALFSLS